VTVNGGPNQYFSPAGLVLGAVGTLGDIGRDTMVGPGLANLDMAVLKTMPVRKVSEAFNIQFRAEFFDLLNHPNWAQPVNSLFLNAANGGTPNPAVGKINGILGNTRQIQLGLRIGF
jgi:hypothetical protein